YSAMKSARALGFATSRHLHHVPGHDPLSCFNQVQCTRSILRQYHPQAALTTRPEAQSVSTVTRAAL
ncbi:hypothetical protein ACC839_32810, partial [Rhizobium ruizarguesonis]